MKKYGLVVENYYLHIWNSKEPYGSCNNYEIETPSSHWSLGFKQNQVYPSLLVGARKIWTSLQSSEGGAMVFDILKYEIRMRHVTYEE